MSMSTTSYHPAHHHHHHHPGHYMTPTRAGSSSGGSSGARRSPLAVPKSRVVSHSNRSDFLFSSLEYDLFLKNLQQQNSPPIVSPLSSSRNVLYHSVSFSPQPTARHFGTRPQSAVGTSVSLQHHYQSQASHSLSSSASSTASSPARSSRPLVASHETPLEPEEDEFDEDSEVQSENLSHQHLHALHRFRRQREKGVRSQLRDIVISFTPKARGSILNREHVFVRFGLEEWKALAAFDFLQADDSEPNEKEDCRDDAIDLEQECRLVQSCAQLVDHSASSSSSSELTSPQVDRLRRSSFGGKSRSLDHLLTGARAVAAPISNSFEAIDETTSKMPKKAK